MSGANNVSNVSTGTPKAGGYAYRGAKGVTLPTDAKTALDEALNCLGLISEDGVTQATARESEDIKDWQGVTVLSPQTGYSDTWKFVMIESKSIEVLKTIYGDENVSGDLDTGITVKANANELDYAAYVFEMVLNGGAKKRVVLPNAKPTEFEEVTHKSGEVIGYGVTLTCAPDENSNTHYEYIANK